VRSQHDHEQAILLHPRSVQYMRAPRKAISYQFYNAFLDWRRAPLSLHNATDVNVVGNYYQPILSSAAALRLAVR
jgi:hypothetical protein